MVCFLWRKCYGVVNDAHLGRAVGNKTEQIKRGERRDRRRHKEKKENIYRGRAWRRGLQRDQRGGRTREMDGERTRGKRDRVITRARYTGREGMFSSC